VCFGDASVEVALHAWEELMSMLERQFPDGSFRRPDFESLDSACSGDWLPPVMESRELQEQGGGGESALQAPEATAPLEPSTGLGQEETDLATEPEAFVADDTDVAPTAWAGPVRKPVKCGRVFLTAHHHDEKTDLGGRLVSSDGKKRQSFFSYLRVSHPQVSGFLSFGRPAVIVAEGPLVLVDKFLCEVRRFKEWGDLKQKHFEVTPPMQEVKQWRAFESFRKVKTEELEGIFENIKHQEWYQLVLADYKKPRRKSRHR